MAAIYIDMKIDYKGRKIDAFPLIMRKENALDILSGKKTIEFRHFCPKYEKMFTDFKQIKKNEELIAQGREQDCLPPFNAHVEGIHFYPYNNSWHLDVIYDEIGVVELTEEDAKYMAEKFGCHDLDDQWQQYAHLPKEDIPFMFFFRIDEIVSHHGLQ